MPFKLRIISQIQKSVHSLKKEEQAKEEQEKIQAQKQNQVVLKSKGKSKKRLVDKNYNFFQLLYKQEPSLDHHVVNFFNITGLNEKAICCPNYEESKFTTIFYIKNVKKVEIKNNFIAMQLCNSPLSFPPIQYIINRYKSFGDVRFYNLALLLQDATKRIKSIQDLEITEKIDENDEYFDKFVEGLGNKMFVCRSTGNRLVISKALLQLLEYNPQEMALDIVKYKAPLFEIFSSERYFDIAFKMIENLKNLFDFINDKITLEGFLNSSLIRFKDYLITRNNKKVYCKLKVGMPNPMLNLIEVEEVLYSSDPQISELTDSLRKFKINQIQREREKQEINTIRRLLPLPKNLLPENTQRVSSYCSKVGEISNQNI